MNMNDPTGASDATQTGDAPKKTIICAELLLCFNDLDYEAENFLAGLFMLFGDAAEINVECGATGTKRYTDITIPSSYAAMTSPRRCAGREASQEVSAMPAAKGKLMGR